MVDDNLLMSQNSGIKWMKKPNNIKIETMAALRGEDDQILHLSLISAPVNDVMLDTNLCVICNITKCHFMTKQSKYLTYTFSI